MPVVTRLAVETELVDRVGGLLSFTGKTVTATGANPSLTGPIAFAATHLNVALATPGSVDDTDLAVLDVTQFYALCDLAEYRAIRSCLGNFVLPNETAQDRQQAWGSLRQQFQATADDLETRYAGLLNPRRAPTMVGKTNFHFPTPGHAHWGLGRGRSDH